MKPTEFVADLIALALAVIAGVVITGLAALAFPAALVALWA